MRWCNVSSSKVIKGGFIDQAYRVPYMFNNTLVFAIDVNLRYDNVRFIEELVYWSPLRQRVGRDLEVLWNI